MSIVKDTSAVRHVQTTLSVGGRMETGAFISVDRIYRYYLWRVWSSDRPKMGYVMVNPSTANEVINDPTVTWCAAYAKKMGYGGILIANLYAARATFPESLAQFTDPVGPLNPDSLMRLRREASVVIAAWGNSCLYCRGPTYAREVADRLRPLFALGVTAVGHPKHPLFFARGNDRPQFLPFEYPEAP